MVGPYGPQRVSPLLKVRISSSEEEQTSRIGGIPASFSNIYLDTVGIKELGIPLPVLG